ncbi:MAG: substrate-binding domain-containing protein, partial [Rhodospirillaceae bacterium]|nr:substrate-binding domain-containing protein [Rhodospirillaceae bacterium]
VATMVWPAAASSQDIPSYTPSPVTQPKASYVGADGAVTVIGYNDMDGMLASINTLFTAAHPHIHFRMILKGTRTAPPALADGTSAFAPMGAPFSPQELENYRAKSGHEPIMVRVAHASLNDQAKSGPLGVFVAASNPVRALTMQHVASAFAGPSPLTWRALGVDGPQSDAPVRRIGLHAETALGRFMLERMSQARYSADFEGLAQSRDVVAAVAADPTAIGFAAANLARPGVRVVPLVVDAQSEPVAPTPETLQSGVYPLDRHLYIFLRRPIDPLVAEYLRLVLSREGQAAIAAEPLGYIPLSAEELRAERAKLPP